MIRLALFGAHTRLVMIIVCRTLTALHHYKYCAFQGIGKLFFGQTLRLIQIGKPY